MPPEISRETAAVGSNAKEKTTTTSSEKKEHRRNGIARPPFQAQVFPEVREGVGARSSTGSRPGQVGNGRRGCAQIVRRRQHNLQPALPG